MTQDQRLFYDARQLRPVSVYDMQIRVTDAADVDLNENLTLSWFWNCDVLNLKWAPELTKYRSFHRSSHTPRAAGISDFNTTQEKVHRAEDSIGQPVGPG